VAYRGIDNPDGDDPDGANRLFKVLVKGAPMAYHRFAEEYYVTAVDPKTVSETFALRPLTDELVRRLDADLVVADLAQDRYRPGRHSGSPHRADRRRARSVDRAGRWTFFRRHRPHINKIAPRAPLSMCRRPASGACWVAVARPLSSCHSFRWPGTSR